MKKITCCKVFLMTALLMSSAWSEVRAQLLVENFNYPAGNLLTAHGWTNHSGTTNFIKVSNQGLTYTGYAGSNVGNSARLITAGGEDVNRKFDSISTGSVYTAFLVKVDTAKTTGDYFFHLGPYTLGSTFRSRVWVKTNGTNIAFGISPATSVSTTALKYTGFNYTIGTTYLLVIKSTFGEAPKLFINPIVGSPEPTATVVSDTILPPGSFGTVALRQGASTSTPGLLIDGIRIDTTWAGAVAASNDPPTSFNLLEPANGFRWEVSVSSTDSMYYRWNRSIDPEGSSVFYSFEYDTSATMDSPFHDFYPIGTDTFYVDYARWDAEWLQDLGIDSMTMYWRIIASDGDNETVSSQLWSVKYVLIPEANTKFSADLAGYQVVPPTNSQFTGWGYFEMSSDSSSLFYRIYIPDGVSPVTIRNNWAGSGSDEPVLYEYNLVGDSAVGTQVIPINIARELCAGRLYILHPGAGIRGQIYKGTSPVLLNPARELNVIEFEESIELDWTEPLSVKKSSNVYRFRDKQFSRSPKKADVTESIQTPGYPGLLTGYNIYRSVDGFGFMKIAQTNSLYYIDSNVTAGNTYWYFVSAVYLEGQAHWTDTVEATPTVGFSFVEGFNDTSMTVSGELPAGWTKMDADGGDEDPFWGEWRVMPDLNASFTTFEGDGMMFINYKAANSNGLINEWLISPRLITSQSSMVRLAFAARASGGDWPDSMQVLVSKTTSAPNQFTLIDYFLVTGDWEQYDYNLMLNGVLPGDTFYVAFRYLIYDGGSYGSNSDMLMLDYVRIDGMPMPVGVDEPISGTPKSFALFQNYPNPFNPTTSIKYDLKDKAKVTLKIYNMLGQEVRTLVSREQSPGQYTMEWDGKNNAGLSVSSGVYIYRIQAGDFVKAKKMMFIK